MSNEITQASYKVEVDVEKINRLLTQLNNKEAGKAFKSALRKSVLVIKKQAQKNLVAYMPNANKASTRKGVTHRPLKNEIRIGLSKKEKFCAIVGLVDLRQKDSRAYILRFIECGTVDRKIKYGERHGQNRGRMKAYNFFGNAVTAKKAEAESTLEQNIVASIQKVIDRNKSKATK